MPKSKTKKTPKESKLPTGRVKKIKKVKKEKKPLKITKKPVKYFEEVGRRKTATARVRISQKEKSILINGKPFENYFPTSELQEIVLSPFKIMDYLDKFGISVKVRGGGVHAQAEAVRHGIAKALVLFNPEFRKKLKKAGFLTRDPRMRERKKFGLKRARRAPQWQKR